MFNYTYIRKKNLELQSNHNFVYVQISYMFRLYIYSHHNVEYRNTNKKEFML